MRIKDNGDYIVPEQFKNDVGKVAEALIPLVTEKRIAKMREVVQKRSSQICTVFENTHHAHNISARVSSLRPSSKRPSFIVASAFS